MDDSGWISLDEKMPEPGVSVILEAQEGDGFVGLCIAHRIEHVHFKDQWFLEIYGYQVSPAPNARWHPLPPREEGE